MSLTMRGVGRGGVLAALTLSVLGGCAGQGNAEADNAAAVALQFSQFVDTAPASACGLLAPETLKELEDGDGPCAGGLPSELDVAGGSVESAEVYGKDAIVRLASDTIFLARFPQGWRVTAAGCTRPRDARPYGCKVKGT